MHRCIRELLAWCALLGACGAGIAASIESSPEDPPVDLRRFPTGVVSDTTDVVAVVGDSTLALAIDGAILRIPYYCNRTFGATHPTVTRAVVVLHGTLRNADSYFRSIVDAAASVPGAPAQTLIFAPQFLTEADLIRHELPDDYLYWSYMGWRQGDISLSGEAFPRPGRISSFSVADTILSRIVERCPSLQTIVVVGHSAGGQFSNRYAAGNRIHDTIVSGSSVTIRYIISNPSSYIYFNEERWVRGTSYEFAVPPDTTIQNCPDYDHYKYGLLSPNEYMDIGSDQLRNQYSERRVVYLLGSNDTDPNSYYLDRACPAMIQGLHRFERGIVYHQHLEHYFGEEIHESHILSIVLGIGHNHYLMFNSACGLQHIFDHGDCTLPPPLPPPWEEMTPSVFRNLSIHSVAFCDHNGDRAPDLYLTILDDPNRLFNNVGNGMWFDASAPPINDPGPGACAAWGDYDNDGCPDLYLARWQMPSRLFRHKSGNVFADVTTPSLAIDGELHDASWVDFDLDGDLDLYVARGAQPNVLLRNDGPAGFVGATAPPLDNPVLCRDASWGDYDDDGDLDLYVSNETGNRLFRNDREAGFTDVTTPILAGDGGGSSAAWGDYDNDGRLDLYLVQRARPNRLLRNTGGGFADATAPPLDDPGIGASAAWGDYDNDGRLDLFLSNLSGPSFLFWNKGDGTFSNATPPPMAISSDTQGAAWVDVEGDGDLDILLATRAGSPKLIRNNLPGHTRWLHIDLVGVESNVSAIGARIRIVTEGGVQVREIADDAGARSQNSPTAEFGLGLAEIVDTLQVRWPSGTVQSVAGVGPNQRLLVRESDQPNHALAGDAEAIASLCFPNPFRGGTTIRLLAPTEESIRIGVFDLAGRRVRSLPLHGRRLGEILEIHWDGRSDEGRTCSPGIYLCRVQSRTRTVGIRVVLVD